MSYLQRRLPLLPALLLLVPAALPVAAHAQRPPRGLPARARPALSKAQARAQEKPRAEKAPEDAKAAERRRAVRKKNVPLKLDFDRVDITEVVKTISDITGKNFILPDNIRGKITILSPTAVTPDQAYAAFLSALEANNLSVYSIGKFLKIVPKKEATRSNIPTVVEPGGFYPWNEQMVTRVFRLQHVEADSVTNIIKSLQSRDGDLQSYPPDLLIVTDVSLNLHRLEKIIDQIDQPGGADQIRILQVKYADATDIAEKLMQIFEGSGGNATPARTTTARRRVRRPTPQPQQQDEGLDVEISRVIADERTNKLIVIADEKSFQRIEEILAQLDVPTEGEGQVHVHYLTNANAEELASTLSQLAQGTGTTTRARPGRPATKEAPGAAELFQGEVKITADKGTNSLVIVSSYNDYKNLARVIDKLDIARRQVFVEAVIMEVDLDSTNELGLSFHQGAAPTIDAEGNVAPVILGTQLGGLNSLSLSGLLQFGGFLAGIQGPPVPGTESLGVSIPSFGVVLQALQTDNRVNVLSTPHILTSDNEEAEITVGQNVPFQAGFAPQGFQSLLGGTGTTAAQNAGVNPAALAGLTGLTSGLSSFYAPIQRQNVELRLKIKPQINESDFVRLNIEEQTEEIVSTDRVLGPTTAKRTAKSTVVAKDGQTVVIGGLIQERNVETVNKIPLLGDIPVFGWLFRNTTKKAVKTNLLLFLTPYVIRSPADFRIIFERKLAERKKFVEQFYDVTGYEGNIDYARRVGPLGELTRTLREERNAPENGGPGQGVKIITPSEPAPAPKAAPEAQPDEGATPAPETAPSETPEPPEQE